VIDPKELLAKTTDALSVGRVFGSPIEKDGCLIIPVAWSVGGGGTGVEVQPDGSADPACERVGSGFGGVTFPVGVYAVENGKVRWVPVLDVTWLLLAIAAIAALLTRSQVKRSGPR
jgi:uncharacterized spore protein YtfJ